MTEIQGDLTNNETNVLYAYVALKVYKSLMIIFFQMTRGRCYDHNFLRLFPIVGEKIGVYLKYQCYDHIFFKFCLCFQSKTPIFSLNVSAKRFNKSVLENVGTKPALKNLTTQK
jgi:hypothetical protein